MGTCYGNFRYCSRESKRIEPCIDETILDNPQLLKEFCQDVVHGKNVTDKIAHSTCDIEGPCKALLFKSHHLSSDPGTEHNHIAVWIVASVFIALCFAFLIYILVRRLKRRRKQETKQDEEATVDDSAVAIAGNNRLNETNEQNGIQQRYPEQNMTGNNAETIPLMQRNDGSAQGTPDSGIVPTLTDRSIDSSGSSASNRISNHSLAITTASTSSQSLEGNHYQNSPDSSTSLMGSQRREEAHHQNSPNSSTSSMGSQHREEAHHQNFPDSSQPGVHPAVIENEQLRQLHMPSSEPSGPSKIATSHSTYNHTPDGNRE